MILNDRTIYDSDGGLVCRPLTALEPLAHRPRVVTLADFVDPDDEPTVVLDDPAARPWLQADRCPCFGGRGPACLTCATARRVHP